MTVYVTSDYACWDSSFVPIIWIDKRMRVIDDRHYYGSSHAENDAWECAVALVQNKSAPEYGAQLRRFTNEVDRAVFWSAL